MNFFEAQDLARRRTRLAVLLFGAAVLALVLVTHLLVLAVLAHLHGQVPSREVLLARFDAPTFAWVSLAVIGTIAAGTLYKLRQLAAGGHVVAESLGGRRVPGDSADPAERRLLNVVEEMAIASGTPVPPVYLLEEDAINAFAAGLTPHDAVIGITRGAAAQLSRDELQGVVAHEFSHILNGDMRLNQRLAGVLNGILLLGIVGQHLVRSRRRTRRGRGQGGQGVAAVLLLGAGLILIGYLGTFFGQWIKAVVSRQREYLADASAVQFTRNPGGIAGALKKIGAAAAGARLAHPAAPQFSHAYFAQGIGGVWTRALFATHPPLAERIRRLEPAWNGRYPAPAEGPADRAPPSARGAPAGAEAFPLAAALAAVDRIGVPAAEDLGQAREVLGRIPEPVRAAARLPGGAQAVILGLALSARAAPREAERAFLRAQATPQLGAAVASLDAALARLDRRLRLPVIDLALPALHGLPAADYARFRALLQGVVRADGRLDLGEWVLQRMVVHGLDAVHGLRRPPAPRLELRGLAREAGMLLALLAWAVHLRADAARRAFAAGARPLGLAETGFTAREGLSLLEVDLALARLEALKPLAKPALLKACVACAAQEGRVGTRGVELLRAIAASLDCPMPRLPGA